METKKIERVSSSASETSPPNEQSKGPVAQLITYTYTKHAVNPDTSPLFYYKSKEESLRQEFTIESTSKMFFRQNNELHLVNENKNLSDIADIIRLKFLFKKLDGELRLRCTQKTDPYSNNIEYEDNFLIVASLRDPKNRDRQIGYNLKLGDIFRLGSVDYRIIQMCKRPGEIERANFELFKYTETQEIFEKEQNSSEPCHYCHSLYLDDSPLEIDKIRMNLCLCKGSMGSVHYSCLATWLKFKQKKAQKEDKLYTLEFRRQYCEICNYGLPSIVKYKGVDYEVVSFEINEETPHFVVERYNPDVPIIPTITVISLKNGEQVQIGRGDLCYMYTSDTVISNNHALFKFEDGEFKIFDTDSTYGTLIKLTHDVPITYDKVSVQSGNSIAIMVLKKPESK